MESEELRDRIVGLLLGTAVGDAIALPMEGLSRRRVGRMFRIRPLRHALVFGHGMISDDTEHACMTAQAILAVPDDAGGFAKSLGWRLRFWLLGIPAGIGFATLRAILKLWCGFPVGKSGVWSAGNGPAMRAPIIGAALGEDERKALEYIRAATRLTHSDPTAEIGAACVAWVANYAMSHETATVDPLKVVGELRVRFGMDQNVLQWVCALEQAVGEKQEVSQLCEALGLSNGVSGYIHHTVPIAIYCWLRHLTDYRAAIEDVVSCGGDTDSVAAITGALCGALNGLGVIPAEWVNGLLEFPRDVEWMTKLGTRIAHLREGQREAPLQLRWWWIPIRNVLFAVVVLLHGVRRLAPPY